ncbi:cupredoxin domain-containing protein [Cohnella endophytica]|nr:cupredoxin family copper-binding protein [Cohnella endophytica]
MAVIFLAMMFMLAACSSSGKEEGTPSSNNVQSESQGASQSASTSPVSASPDANTEPSHSHDSSATASEGPSKSSPSPKPLPSPSRKPAESSVKPSPAPSVKPSEGSSASAESESPKQEVIVEIKDFAFSPEKVTVRKGTKVTFINRDKIKHTATGDNGEFDTGLLGQDVPGDVIFDEAGTFAYHCEPHPGMTGTIVVEDE